MHNLVKIVVTVGIGWTAVASAAEFKVAQKNKAFSVPTLTIKVGDTVNFSNEDTVAHNIFTLSDPEQFDLGTTTPSQSKPFTFKKPGTYDVECAIHTNMKMTITVK